MENALSRPKKALPHVATALLAKRNELKRLIRLCDQRLKTATAELATIDAALQIFKSEIDPGPVTIRPAHAAFRSETAKIVLHAIRVASEKLTTWELTEIVMRERGLSVDDHKLCRTMQMRVRACLNHYRDERATLRSLRGAGGLLVWEVVSAQERTALESASMIVAIPSKNRSAILD